MGCSGFAVDELVALYNAECLDLVAITGGFFKLQIRGGGLHFVLQGAGQFVGFAVEESGGLTHAVAVVFFADVSDAGRGAAFDLVQ